MTRHVVKLREREGERPATDLSGSCVEVSGSGHDDGLHVEVVSDHCLDPVPVMIAEELRPDLADSPLFAQWLLTSCVPSLTSTEKEL
ncbi:hypothetical protein KPL76_01150 [Subtercola sp. PAMC28395]|uniref:hypothetical protein n=1 Tax=Subtercola sp. PAMC28395 TaxID=2846775 RepID=UPI001C0D1EA3|nr:hypothetical protein [Subtercola sp. PAMC28395]QWT24079.1 hypothetical protein KPL76_01150 [Subtercola sp. PAMC28395]